MALVLVVLLYIIECFSAKLVKYDLRINEDTDNSIYYDEAAYLLSNQEDWNENEIDDEMSGRMLNWLLIFPGTKWCGAGNISENHDDLGQFADTDKCCRNHDLCNDTLNGYETKVEYNLTNPAFYTRLNCECDDEFLRCLKSVNSRVSTKIGFIYFNALGTQCFRKDYPATCTRNTFVPVWKCVEYEYDTTGEKVYQWFDVSRY